MYKIWHEIDKSSTSVHGSSKSCSLNLLNVQTNYKFIIGHHRFSMTKSLFRMVSFNSSLFPTYLPPSPVFLTCEQPLEVFLVPVASPTSTPALHPGPRLSGVQEEEWQIDTQKTKKPR